MIMTLRHLEIFLAVYDNKNMRRAAEKLYISQPTVSEAVREMEAEYGVLLFERLNHRLFVTAEGERLAAYARQLLGVFHEMEESLNASAQHPMLRIGATLTVGTCVLPEILQRMQEEEKMPATVIVKNTHSIEELVARGELDIGFVEGEISRKELVAVSVMEDPLTAVSAQPNLQPMTLAEMCRRFPLLMRETGSGNRAMVEETLHQKGVSYEERWVCSNTQALLRAAEAGLGTAILSRLLAEELIQQGKLFEIHLTDCQMIRFFRLVWHKDKFQNSSFQCFCRLCREYAAEKKEDGA